MQQNFTTDEPYDATRAERDLYAGLYESTLIDLIKTQRHAMACFLATIVIVPCICVGFVWLALAVR